MDSLKSHPHISSFLSSYPESLHSSCILALCLLGLSVAKLRKSDFDLFLNKVPKVPPKLNLKPLTQETQPSTAETFRTANSFHPLKPEFSRPPKSRNCSGSSTCRSAIDLADGFFGSDIVKEIYQREMIADRTKVPFRKKWDLACKKLSSDRLTPNSIIKSCHYLVCQVS